MCVCVDFLRIWRSANDVEVVEGLIGDPKI